MPGDALPDTCLVHLVWAPLGPGPLRRFVESYAAHDAGVEHRLVMIYNGFAPREDTSPWDEALRAIAHQVVRLEHPVLDLVAYRELAEGIPARCYCFLNSYSVVQDDGWLALMVEALRRPAVGLVGASGSWASMSSLTRYQLGLGGPYGDVFEDRREVHEQLGLLSGEGAPGSPVRLRERRTPAAVRALRAVAEQSLGFFSFPAPHVRTNGFLIRREVLRSLRMRTLSGKIDAHRFESGRRGLTTQVHSLGLSTLVVARGGETFAPEQWHLSRTFWQGEQERLLIADNQTESYARGDERMRRFLARYAWGQKAAPA